jgi:hypothetical protein
MKVSAVLRFPVVLGVLTTTLACLLRLDAAEEGGESLRPTVTAQVATLSFAPITTKVYGIPRSQ